MPQTKAIRHLKACDPVLAGIIESVGPIQQRYQDPTFASLVRAILYQQIHGNAAFAIHGRFVAAAGGRITPQSILDLTEEQMRGCGLSRQKTSYIRDLAAKTLSREIVFDDLHRLPDEEVIEHLTKVKGIGEWSAQMFLMSALRRGNVMPTGDFGIRLAIMKAYRKRKMPKPDFMLKISKAWQPYRSLACYYLWRSLEL